MLQTFLPYPDFEETARCLDQKRLGKQRSEAKTILKILLGWTRKRGWRHHTAIRMWKGYAGCLVIYYNTMLDEWECRGKNNIKLKHQALGRLNPRPPPWLGDWEFHASHRSNLLLKAPEHYGKFGWSELPGLPYVWPKGK